jgi:hypothetical protein
MQRDLYRFISCLIIMAGCGALYLSTFSGHVVSGDNQTQFIQTLQIMQGSIGFDSPAVHPTFPISSRFKEGRSGYYYQCYGIGHSLLSLPGTLLAKTLFADSVRMKKGLLQKAWVAHALLFSAAIVALLWIAVRQFVAKVPRLLLILSAAVASPLWMMSDQNWNNLSATAFLSGALACLFSYRGKRLSPTRAALIGFLVAMGSFVRPFALTTVPAFLFILWYCSNRSEDKWHAQEALCFLLPIAICIIWMLLFNMYRFGSPFDFGYPQVSFRSSWWHGFWGSIAGPAKSPLYFSPALLMLIPALLVLFRRLPAIGLFTLLYCAPYLILIPKWWAWWGGPDLFQRFWLPLVPMSYLAIGIGFSRLRSRSSRSMFAILFIVLSLIGTYHQFLSASTDTRTVYELADRLAGNTGPETGQALEAIRLSPLMLVSGLHVVADTQKTLLTTQPKNLSVLPSFVRPDYRCFAAGGLLLIAFVTALLLEVSPLHRSSSLPEASAKGKDPSPYCCGAPYDQA